MKLPDFIETQFGDTLKITDYKDGKFIVEGSPTIVSYKISSNDFQRLGDDGREYPYGVQAKDHEKYLKWMKENT